MSSYREGAYSGYWLSPVTDPRLRAEDAVGLARGIYWLAWVYFIDGRLVWC